MGSDRFEPIAGLVDKLPTNEEMINPLLVTVRIAACILEMSKTELVERLPGILDAEEDCGVFRRMDENHEALKALAAIIETAMFRMAVAEANIS
jgi:hypothetical protein